MATTTNTNTPKKKKIARTIDKGQVQANVVLKAPKRAPHSQHNKVLRMQQKSQKNTESKALKFLLRVLAMVAKRLSVLFKQQTSM